MDMGRVRRHRRPQPAAAETAAAEPRRDQRGGGYGAVSVPHYGAGDADGSRALSVRAEYAGAHAGGGLSAQPRGLSPGAAGRQRMGDAGAEAGGAAAGVAGDMPCAAGAPRPDAGAAHRGQRAACGAAEHVRRPVRQGHGAGFIGGVGADGDFRRDHAGDGGIGGAAGVIGAVFPGNGKK